MLKDFLATHFFRVPGASVPFEVLAREYLDYLQFRGVEAAQWPPISQIRRELRQNGLVVGHSGGRAVIGNLASPRSNKKWKETSGGQLRKVDAEE